MPNNNDEISKNKALSSLCSICKENTENKELQTLLMHIFMSTDSKFQNALTIINSPSFEYLNLESLKILAHELRLNYSLKCDDPENHLRKVIKSYVLSHDFTGITKL